MPAIHYWRFLLAGFAIFLTSPAFADLRLLLERFDLGELRGAAVFSRRIEYINDGKLPLEIVDVKRACGCLAPVLTKKTLAPGEKADFVMQVRTIGQPNGPRTWQATIVYRQGDKILETPLILAGNVQNDVSLEPTNLVLSVSGVLKQEVRIVDRRKPGLTVTAVRVNAKAVRVATEAGPAGLTKILLEVHGKELAEDRLDAMLDLYTDDPLYGHFQVPITLLKAATAIVTPSPDIARITPGASGIGSALVRLRNTGEKPLAIERVQADHPALRCTCAIGPGNDATLRIQVDTKQLSMAPLPEVVVHFRDGTMSPVRVPVELRRD
jgi:hypothetical protein